MKKRIPHRNRSPYGWWIASYVLRAAWDDVPRPKSSSRQLIWKNTIVLKASNRNQAYTKAMRLGKLAQSNFWNKTSRKGRWVFEGLSSLLPIYEKFDDGAEVLWQEYNISFKKMRSWIKRKHALETFDDTPSLGDLLAIENKRK